MVQKARLITNMQFPIRIKELKFQPSEMIQKKNDINFFIQMLCLFREQSSVNKSSDDSDLETPVQVPTSVRGRKRAAETSKATPV